MDSTRRDEVISIGEYIYGHQRTYGSAFKQARDAFDRDLNDIEKTTGITWNDFLQREPGTKRFAEFVELVCICAFERLSWMMSPDSIAEMLDMKRTTCLCAIDRWKRKHGPVSKG